MLEAFKPKNTIPIVKPRGGRIMVWECFAVGGSDPLEKIDDIMGKEAERNVHVLKQHLKTLARRFTFGHK